VELVDSPLAELEEACPGAKRMAEGGKEYIYLPTLTIRRGKTVFTLEGLLTLSEAAPYPTRLFLSQPIPNAAGFPPLNWHHQVHVMGRTWHTWSWKDVTADASLLEILRAHLGAFKP
jgi:hypothetical protein